MKKVLLSLSLIAAFFVYLLVRRSGQTVTLTPGNATNNQNTPPSPSNPSGPIAVSTPTPAAPVPKPKSSGLYNDGTYVGGVADAYYGYVQVKAVVQNGSIADVQFLQYPNTHSYSIEVNSQAMPYLKQEAIQAQSANVDIVSGATQTSEAFIQSLGDALTQAKA